MQRNEREVARTSLGSDAAYDLGSRRGSVARSTLHRGAHRAEKPGCRCQQPKPPRARRPHPRVDGPADRPAGPRATRGGDQVRQRPALDAPPQLCSCGRSEPQQATFCWSLPDHLPLRPDAPDAQNALSGDLVQKSSLSGKMVISPMTCRERSVLIWLPSIFSGIPARTAVDRVEPNRSV